FEFNEEDKIEFNEESNKAESNEEDKIEFNKENMVNEYNHPIVKDARVISEYRQLTRDAKCIAMQMLKVGTKLSMIYEAIRDENEESTMTRKDISNLGTQIYLTEENTSIEVLITNIEKRGDTKKKKIGSTKKKLIKDASSSQNVLVLHID
ncbi:6387_t:CDS:2, partial [Racocetra fulgida]